MGQHRNSAAAENTRNRLLGSNVIRPDAQLVDEALDRDLFCFGIAVLHHQIADVRLAGVVQRQQLVDLLLRKLEPKARFQKIEPRLYLFHAQAVAKSHDALDRIGIRVVTVAENMIFTFFILAGKFHAGQKHRIMLFPHRADHGATLDCVMIGQRKQLKPGLPDAKQQLLRGVGSVGNSGVHV